jgi:hypothetical protein
MLHLYSSSLGTVMEQRTDSSVEPLDHTNSQCKKATAFATTQAAVNAHYIDERIVLNTLARTPSNTLASQLIEFLPSVPAFLKLVCSISALSLSVFASSVSFVFVQSVSVHCVSASASSRTIKEHAIMSFLLRYSTPSGTKRSSHESSGALERVVEESFKQPKTKFDAVMPLLKFIEDGNKTYSNERGWLRQLYISPGKASIQGQLLTMAEVQSMAFLRAMLLRQVTNWELLAFAVGKSRDVIRQAVINDYNLASLVLPGAVGRLVMEEGTFSESAFLRAVKESLSKTGGGTQKNEWMLPLASFLIRGNNTHRNGWLRLLVSGRDRGSLTSEESATIAFLHAILLGYELQWSVMLRRAFGMSDNTVRAAVKRAFPHIIKPPQNLFIKEEVLTSAPRNKKCPKLNTPVMPPRAVVAMAHDDDDTENATMTQEQENKEAKIEEIMATGPQNDSAFASSMVGKHNVSFIATPRGFSTILGTRRRDPATAGAASQLQLMRQANQTPNDSVSRRDPMKRRSTGKHLLYSIQHHFQRIHGSVFTASAVLKRQQPEIDLPDDEDRDLLELADKLTAINLHDQFCEPAPAPAAGAGDDGQVGACSDDVLSIITNAAAHNQATKEKDNYQCGDMDHSPIMDDDDDAAAIMMDGDDDDAAAIMDVDNDDAATPIFTTEAAIELLHQELRKEGAMQEDLKALIKAGSIKLKCDNEMHEPPAQNSSFDTNDDTTVSDPLTRTSLTTNAIRLITQQLAADEKTKPGPEIMALAMTAIKKYKSSAMGIANVPYFDKGRRIKTKVYFDIPQLRKALSATETRRNQQEKVRKTKVRLEAFVNCLCSMSNSKVSDELFKQAVVQSFVEDTMHGFISWGRQQLSVDECIVLRDYARLSTNGLYRFLHAMLVLLEQCLYPTRLQYKISQREKDTLPVAFEMLVLTTSKNKSKPCVYYYHDNIPLSLEWLVREALVQGKQEDSYEISKYHNQQNFMMGVDRGGGDTSLMVRNGNRKNGNMGKLCLPLAVIEEAAEDYENLAKTIYKKKGAVCQNLQLLLDKKLHMLKIEAKDATAKTVATKCLIVEVAMPNGSSVPPGTVQIITQFFDSASDVIIDLGQED